MFRRLFEHLGPGYHRELDLPAARRIAHELNLSPRAHGQLIAGLEPQLDVLLLGVFTDPERSRALVAIDRDPPPPWFAGARVWLDSRYLGKVRRFRERMAPLSEDQLLNFRGERSGGSAFTNDVPERTHGHFPWHEVDGDLNLWLEAAGKSIRLEG